MNFLDYSGLQRFLDRLKAIIPTKTSDITNDSGYLDTTGVQNYMENGGGYSQSYIDTALSGKADSSHTHTKSEITDFPSLATVATSGSYNDLSNTPTIPTVNNKTLTIQKNGTTVNTFTANSASDVTANITVPTAVSELTNDSGYLTSASSLDSSKLTGTIDIARLPKGALERLVTVANQTARFGLTVNDVQLGDTVKQLDTGVMYIVTDESKLNTADGYTEYTAGSATSVPWSGVTGKPADYTPASHSHGNITNDGKVGTTANVPLITGTGGVVQAGSFGNAANTFCEGNDSRLSDARTPVAHTHTKSDVTDLFNSANVWSGDNTYSKALTVEKNSDTNFFLNAKHTAAELGSLPSSDQSITWAFKDKNNDNLCYARVYYETTGGNSFRIFVRNKYTSGAPSTSGTADYAYFGLKINADKSKEGVLRGTFRPYDNNAYDLGSSSYQWNSLYAKNYYYNGTAWGLDKYNQWTGVNDFNNLIGLNNAELWFKHQNIEDITTNPSVDTAKSILQVWNKGTTQYVGGIIDGLDTSGTHVLEIVNFGYPLNSTNAYQHRFRFASKRDGTSSFYPTYPNVDLGTSTNKWKSLNGIVPGALSLPSGYTEEGADKDYINIASVIQTLDGTTYNYTMPDNGWICVRAEQAKQVHVTLSTWYFGQSISHPTGSTLIVSVPFRKNDQITLKVNAVTLQYARFYPMQGNV